MRVRKNQARLTHAERQAFANAVLALKNSVPSQMGLTNRYDDYVQTHMNSMMASPGWAHRRPAFLPWHREFLRRFELDLQAVDPNVTLPYWNWTVDQSADPTVPGSPWTDDLLGGTGDPGQAFKVTGGPFAFDGGSWTVNVTMDPATNFLARDLANGQASTLPSPVNVAGALQVTPYDRGPWSDAAQPSFRNRLEGWYGAGSIHNRVHMWVGGTMTGMDSPNDPVFFLHHANVDRLWAQWQQIHPDQAYAPGDSAASSLRGQRLNDAMNPWTSPSGSVKPAGVLDHIALGYRYDDEPPTPEERPGEHRIFIPAIRRGAAPAGETGGAASAGPAFALSPEDLAAGGHDAGAGAAGADAAQGDAGGPMPGDMDMGDASPTGGGMMDGPMFDLSAEDKAAGGHDPGPN